MRGARLVSAWLPVLLLEITILYLSSRPSFTAQMGVPHLDKVAHLLEYSALGALFFRGLRHSGGRPREAALATWSLVAVLAMADEGLQSRVPGRDSSLADWLADVAGTGVGIWLWALIDRRFGLSRDWDARAEPSSHQG